MSEKEHLRAYLETVKIVEYKLIAQKEKADLEREVNFFISIGFVPCNVGFQKASDRNFHYQPMCKYT